MMSTTQTPTEAQVECPGFAKPQKEHEWLRKLVGEWTFEAESPMGEDQPPMKSSGSEAVRTIGDLWILAEGRGEMPGGGPATMILTIGYDPDKGHFIGTWIGSMMTHLWTYHGELDPEGRVLALHAEGPDMMDPSKSRKYKEVIQIRSDDERTFTSYMLSDDEQWVQIMHAIYRRKK